jgi:hypothetical protein
MEPTVLKGNLQIYLQQDGHNNNFMGEKWKEIHHVTYLQ